MIYTNKSSVTLPNYSHQFLTSRRQEPSVFSLAKDAVNICSALFERTQAFPDRSKWSIDWEFEISPSDYLNSLFLGDEIVTIEEEELIFRPYCLRAVEALEHYEALEEGWDGEDMPAPVEASIIGAYDFLCFISATIEELPEVSPMLDHEGIVSLAFEKDHMYCSLAFYEDREIVTYNLNRRTNESFTSTFLSSDLAKLNGLCEFLESLKG
ncbi:hypothetical protein N7650_14710 [Pseudomonas sp. GD04058]|uniref:hypothetical protein n=1 Tax=Pseudomonas sp. GD04058 TaxID=2975429 RepID=UPI00244CB443|nr:hypothetical protein [Pseudomonas sp. GD04058]MDG9884088.1 hypothetical protein [Pseudomonas sp. GD04058]